MEIKTYEVDQKCELTEKNPFIRLSGVGCPLKGCNCSPEYFLAVSDGKNIISITLTENEFNSLMIAKNEAVEIK